MKLSLVAIQICAAILAFSLDRLSKNWVLLHVQDGIIMPFWPGVVQLFLTQNRGAAFSMGRDNGLLMTFVAASVTVFFIGWAIWRHRLFPNRMALEKFGTGLLLGGALGNLFDRFTQGQVTDFLQFTFFDFPIFNVADALIDVGLVFIFIDLFINSNSNNSKSDQKPAALVETEKHPG